MTNEIIPASFHEVAAIAKAVSGFGVLITGLLLDYAIRFPANAVPGEVGTDIVFRLGVVGGVLVPVLYLVPYYLATLYRISRERHAEIRAALAARAAASSRCDIGT